MTSTTRPGTHIQEPIPGGEWERHVLPSGLTVILERVPYVSSISAGLWVKSGTRDEENDVAGIAHFIEHMLFKGTRRRDTYQIACALESVGGELDAFTGRESTCFYARSLSEHLELATDLIADLTCHPRMDAADIEKEKKVILDEIHSAEDNPEDLVQEQFSGELCQGHPLGRPILGTPASIQRLDRDQVLHWWDSHYRADNLVFSVAGLFNTQKVLELARLHFDRPPGSPPRRSDPLPSERTGLVARVKDLSQEQVVLGQLGVSQDHPDRFAHQLLSTILGGGMSSRLFQSIREREGLSYSVYSYSDFHRDTGIFGATLGCAPEETQRALDVLRQEYETFRREGLRAGELESARAQARGSILMGQESMGHRMSQNARSEIHHGRRVPVEELLENLERARGEDLERAAQRLLDPAHSLVTALGPCRNLRW